MTAEAVLRAMEALKAGGYLQAVWLNPVLDCSQEAKRP